MFPDRVLLQILCSKLGSGTILSVFPKQNAFPLTCSVYLYSGSSSLNSRHVRWLRNGL